MQMGVQLGEGSDYWVFGSKSSLLSGRHGHSSLAPKLRLREGVTEEVRSIFRPRVLWEE